MARKKKHASRRAPRRSSPHRREGVDLDLAANRMRKVLEGRAPWALERGDSRDVLAALPDASVDAMVTDPPAGIEFMGEEWDSFSQPPQPGDDPEHSLEQPRGRMKVRYGTTGLTRKANTAVRENFIASLLQVFAEALRVLKPGAHGLVWALPKTSHWTATALEDAGFEVRDVITHHFGNGFPKSLNASKAIDSHLSKSDERPVTREGVKSGAAPDGPVYQEGLNTGFKLRELTGPATAEATAWDGFGTALKPATENWILVRKPLDGSVARNVLRHGTGALNVDACRIAMTEEDSNHSARPGHSNRKTSIPFANHMHGDQNQIGRWPANLILSHAAACSGAACSPGCPVAALDEQSGDCRAAGTSGGDAATPGMFMGLCPGLAYDDSGGASRFFYVAKPSRGERDANLGHLSPVRRTDGRETEHEVPNLRTSAVKNHHPTVKAIELMVYLCRLVTPPGGVVLDPFAGSGTTLVAAIRQGFRAIGIEREQKFFELASERITEDAPLFHRLAEVAVAAAKEEQAPDPQRGLFEDAVPAAKETA